MDVCYPSFVCLLFVQACFDALSKTSGYLTPDLWKDHPYAKSPYQEWSDFLVMTSGKDVVLPKEQPAY